MGAPIEITDYDPAWPRLFEEEKARILETIGPWVVAVEHVGSTAVPGLGAKAIIDIMAGIRDLSEAPNCIGRLEGLGYEYRPDLEVEMPERRYFRKFDSLGVRSHHLHMVEDTSDFWGRHLAFRDYLRSRPDQAERYYRLKKELASRFGSDRIGYTEAKTEFIEGALTRARGTRLPQSPG